MLCLPIDICAHFATRGDTALQRPLGVALARLGDVERFRADLVAGDLARAQVRPATLSSFEQTSLPATSPVRRCRQP